MRRNVDPVRRVEFSGAQKAAAYWTKSEDILDVPNSPTLHKDPSVHPARHEGWIALDVGYERKQLLWLEIREHALPVARSFLSRT